MTIVDVQTHWYSRTLLDAYVESPCYPPCKRDGDGYLLELIEGTWMPVPPKLFELELQMEDFRAAGIDVIISSSASFGDVDQFPVDEARELAVAINEERAAAERDFPGFYGLATLPWQDADAAIAVADDAMQRLGLRGVLLHSNIDGAPVDSDYLLPVYRRLAELGMPVFLHPGRTIMEERVRDYGLEILLAYMADTSIAALRLVLGGVLDEVPDLVVVHPHCGGTLPYLAGRIDGSYFKGFALGRELAQPPSVYLAERFYTDTICQSDESLGLATRFYGVDRMLFGTDYPYFAPGQMLEETRPAFSEADAGKVLSGNAIQLLGLDL